MTWDEMSDRERDALIAETMGWKRSFGKLGEPGYDEYTNLYNPEGEMIASKWGECALKDFVIVPLYTTDDNAFAEVEAALERRGLQEAYAMRLYNEADGSLFDYTDTFGDNPDVDYSTLWSLITAPLDIRCKAALRACGVEV